MTDVALVFLKPWNPSEIKSVENKQIENAWQYLHINSFGKQKGILGSIEEYEIQKGDKLVV